MKKAVLLFIGIFIAWTMYRYFTHFPEWIDEIITKSLIYTLPTIFLTKVIEGRSLKSIGFLKSRLLAHIALGTGIAFLLVCYSFAIQILQTHTFPQLTATISLQTFFLLLVSFFTAFAEELVFRGYMLSRILEQTKDPWIAIGITTVLFAILHIPRAILVLHFSAVQIIAYVWSLCFLGAVDGIVFWKTQSLTSSVTIHTLWNFVQVIKK